MKQDTLIPFETPDDLLLGVPYKFWLLGLSTILMFITLVVFAIGNILYIGIIFFIMPIFCALLVFFPRIFARGIHYKIQVWVWTLSIVVLVGHFIHAILKAKPEMVEECASGKQSRAFCNYQFGALYPVMYVWTWICVTASFMCAAICHHLDVHSGALEDIRFGRWN